MSRPDPSPSQSQQHEDQRIGHFIVKAEIGKGSFAVVHKGFRVASSSLQKEREGRELLRDGRDDRRPSANVSTSQSSSMEVLDISGTDVRYPEDGGMRDDWLGC